MEKVGDIIWDITKYLCGCAKQQANFICGLEENLQSLEAKWNDLAAMKKDVEEKIKADEETGEVQRSHAVTSVANVFGKPKTITDFLPYNSDGFKLNIPSKWNPSKEHIMPVQCKNPDYVHISQDCRHLLSPIFVVNPLQGFSERLVTASRPAIGPMFKKTVDNDLALKIYIKARATPKVVVAFAERGEFDKILIYCKQVGYTPDYLFLLQTILRTDPQGAVNFALMMSQMEGGCPVDYNTITDLFLEESDP